MNKEVLLVIDVQTGTLAPIIRKRRLITNINAIIDSFRKREAQIIFIQQKGYGHVSPELNKHADDLIVNKIKPNAFTSSEFNHAITQTTCESLVVVGLMSNACIQHTCLGALDQNYSVTLLSDAHDSVIPIFQTVYNRKLGKRGIQTVTTNDYLARN